LGSYRAIVENMSSIAAGCHAVMGDEGAVKVARICETKGAGDDLHGRIGNFQDMRRTGEA